MESGFVAPDQRHGRRRFGGDSAGATPRLAVQTLAAAEDLGVGAQVGPVADVLQVLDDQVHGSPAMGGARIDVPRRRGLDGSLKHVQLSWLRKSGASTSVY